MTEPETTLTPPADSAGPSEPPDPEAVETVRGWIISGAPVYEVLESIKTHYPAPDHDAGLLIKTAANEINFAGQMDPNDVRGWCAMAAREVYRKTLAIGDFANSLAAIKLIHQIAKR